MIRRIDDFFIERVFQPIAWRLEWKWDISTFRAARICAHVATVLVLYAEGSKLLITITKGNWFGFVWIFLFLLLGFTVIREANTQERLFDSNPEALNSERLDPVLAVVRVACVPLAVAGALSIVFRISVNMYDPGVSAWTLLAGYVGFLLYYCSFYFIVCTPLPPRKRQERDARNAMKQRLARIKAAPM